MRARSFILVVFILAAAAASSVSPALAQATLTVERMRGMLSGIDTVPSDATWARLGPEAVEVLIAVYEDPATPFFVRLRAVSALAHYPTPAARTFLERVARAPDQSVLVVRRALVALGEAFGDGAFESVRPFLRHPDAAIRRAAVELLVRMDSGRARSTLAAHAARESDPGVLDALAAR
ncbi:MAG: HEAT repeat domain-containing protein [Myxococcales bacterium]|nr:HEAT repeat domain-containing protein [Myxococcales bacterium]